MKKLTYADKLTMAASEGDLKKVKKYLDIGVDVDASPVIDGKTALMQAAMGIDVSMVEFLLEAGANVNAKSKWGRTALMYACDAGRKRIIKTLVEKAPDLDINMQDDDSGTTALMFAVARGQLDTVQYLVEHGADPKISCYFEDALTIATNNRRLDIAEYLESLHTSK